MKKNIYDGFSGWIKYLRDYKHNKENDMISANRLIYANERIEGLETELEEKKELSKLKDDLIQKRDDRVQQITEKYRDQVILNKMLKQDIEDLNNDIAEIENVVKEKVKIIKQLNMKYAQAQRKLQKLEKDVQRKDHQIKFLKSCKDAPSPERIMAYERRMKEVEKRQKENAK